MASLTYVRIFTGDDGLSHFEEVEAELSQSLEASILTETIPVTGMNLRRNLSDYNLDFHPAPRRQFVINLTGTVEIEASDGEVRRFGPGSIMLAEDTTGKGHQSRAVGPEERISVFVHLPD